MLNALRQKFRSSDLSRLCFEDYRRKMATNFSHMSTNINEDHSNNCDNCGNPVRDCQLIECLTEMVLNELSSYVKKDCYGCQQESEGQFVHSQLDHDMCMMTDFEEKAQRYTEIKPNLLEVSLVFLSANHLSHRYWSRVASSIFLFSSSSDLFITKSVSATTNNDGYKAKYLNVNNHQC